MGEGQGEGDLKGEVKSKRVKSNLIGGDVLNLVFRTVFRMGIVWFIIV